MAYDFWQEERKWRIGQTLPYEDVPLTDEDGVTPLNLSGFCAWFDFRYLSDDSVHATRQGLILDAAAGVVRLELEGDEAFKAGRLLVQLTIMNPNSRERSRMDWSRKTFQPFRRDVL